jgi:integrase
MSLSQAKLAVARIIGPLNEGLFREPAEAKKHSVTFGEYVEDEYFRAKAAKWKEDSTRYTTEQRIRKHLIPVLGPHIMRAITRNMLQDALNGLAPTLSVHPLNGLRFNLRDIFDFALADKIVDSNPATILHAPKNCKASGEKKALTSLADLDPIEAVLDVLELAVFRLTFLHGMRIGEVLGLQVGDLQLDVPMLYVKRRLYRGSINTPKNEKSQRDFDLNEKTKAALEQWLSVLNDRSPGAWLFPSDRVDGPMQRDGILKRIQAKLAPLGLEWVTFQVARRTFATIAKKLGVDAHTRAALMGNTVDVNENEYAVATREAKLAAVRKFDSKAVQ